MISAPIEPERCQECKGTYEAWCFDCLNGGDSVRGGTNRHRAHFGPRKDHAFVPPSASTSAGAEPSSTTTTKKGEG